MGSVSARPKAPPTQVVYYTAPAPSPSTPAPTPQETEAEKQQVIQKEREQNLLRRSRGTLGTVLTGFRGILSLNQNDGRKTLLGE